MSERLILKVGYSDWEAVSYGECVVSAAASQSKATSTSKHNYCDTMMLFPLDVYVNGC
ncbi:hypothetical protein E4U14_005547 [Claviceps sp. LM454 group G7]|nr:hypothetical protein E4U14_005547 [Claviceps sp. LM454 group G7]